MLKFDPPSKLISTRQVERLLQEHEGVTLDFKQSMYSIYCGKESGEAIHKGELIKDILSLANRNVAYVGNVSYLIVGAVDKKDENGERQIFDIIERVPDRKELIQLINAYCDPPLENIECEIVEVGAKRLWVVAIPPTAHLHETVKGIMTSRNQDSSPEMTDLIDKKTERPWYSARTAFIRHGEHVRIATMKERISIEKAKNTYMNQRRGIKPAIIGILLGILIGTPIAVNNAKIIGINPTFVFFAGAIVFGFFGGMIGNFLDDIIQISSSFSEFSLVKKMLWIVTLVITLSILIIIYGRLALGLD